MPSSERLWTGWTSTTAALATSGGALSALATTSEGASGILRGAPKTEVVNTRVARKRVEAEEIIVEQDGDLEIMSIRKV
jgi:hypothetical protein